MSSEQAHHQTTSQQAHHQTTSLQVWGDVGQEQWLKIPQENHTLADMLLYTVLILCGLCIWGFAYLLKFTGNPKSIRAAPL